MTEQMQDRFERLEGADNKLELLDAWLGSSGLDFERRKLREARHELTEITAQLREDYGQIVRARDAAIELLANLSRNWFQPPTSVPARIGKIDPLAPNPYSERVRQVHDAITRTIALLRGEDDG